MSTHSMFETRQAHPRVTVSDMRLLQFEHVFSVALSMGSSDVLRQLGGSQHVNKANQPAIQAAIRRFGGWLAGWLVGWLIAWPHNAVHRFQKCMY